MKRYWLRVIVVVAFVVVALLTALATFAPTLAAIACPGCYGFARVEQDVFVDRDATARQRAEARTVVADARAAVAAFYGAQQSTPVLFICMTPACYDRVGGGGSHGQAILDLALFLSPQGGNSVIAAHELSHVELHKRLGRLKTMRRDIPQWFDEGVAVLVSHDPRYPLAQTEEACADAMEGDMPASRDEWVQDPAHDRLYAKAVQRIGCWMAQRGGPAAVPALIGKVAAGLPFDNAFR